MEVALVCGSEFSLDYAANCPLMWLCFYNSERKLWDQMIFEIPSCSESYNSRLLWAESSSVFIFMIKISQNFCTSSPPFWNVPFHQGHTIISLTILKSCRWTTKQAWFLASRGEEFNLGPVMRLNHAEILCNQVLLKYKIDRESFWHQKGAEIVPPPPSPVSL